MPTGRPVTGLAGGRGRVVVHRAVRGGYVVPGPRGAGQVHERVAVAAEVADDRRQRAQGRRVARGRVVHEDQGMALAAAFGLGQADDPVDPVGRRRSFGLPVLGVDRPDPGFHPALPREGERRRAVVAVRGPEGARSPADQPFLLGGRLVKLRGLPRRGERGHVRVVPGVVADEVPVGRLRADERRVGRRVLPDVEERGGNAEPAEHRDDPRRRRSRAVVEGERDRLAAAEGRRVEVRAVRRGRAPG